MLPASRVIGHKEYAAGRKVDPIYDMDWRRQRVAFFTPEDGMPITDVDAQKLVDYLLRYPAWTDGPSVSQNWKDVNKTLSEVDVLDAQGKPTGRTMSLPKLLQWFDNNVAMLAKQNDAQTAQLAAQCAAIQALSTAVAQGTGDPAAVERMVTEHVDAAVARLRITSD